MAREGSANKSSIIYINSYHLENLPIVCGLFNNVAYILFCLLSKGISLINNHKNPA